MLSIFISTDYDLLNRVIGDQKSQKGIPLLDKNDILYFNNDLNIFQVERIDNSVLFLIKDVASSIPVVDKQNAYLMRHSTCNHVLLFKNTQIHALGQHEQYDPYYTKVFDIIFDDQLDKASRIIDFLFKPTTISVSTIESKIFTVQEVREAYTRLHRNLTLYNLSVATQRNITKIDLYKNEIKENYEIVSGYMLSTGNKKLGDLESIENVEELYKFLTSSHFQIHDFLYND